MTTDTKTTIKRATVRSLSAFAMRGYAVASLRLDFGVGEYNPAKDAMQYDLSMRASRGLGAQDVADEFNAQFQREFEGQTVFAEFGDDETLRRLYRYSAPEEWFTLADMLKDAERGCGSL